MTTAVYKLPETTNTIPKNCLVCHLRETTPQDAIAKLQAAGVLAIPFGPSAIALVGYRIAVARLLDFWRLPSTTAEDSPFRTSGYVHRLTLSHHFEPAYSKRRAKHGIAASRLRASPR